MAWTSPRTAVTGEIYTAAILNTDVRDNLRYLKGMDGTVQIQDGLQLTGTGTASYLKVPVLTTTQRDAVVSPANGMVIFNSTDTKLQKYEGTWRSDMAYGGTLTFLAVPSMAQGDIFYADTGTSIARLGAGTSGDYLKTQGSGANPAWTTPALAVALYLNATSITATGAGTLKIYTMPANTISGTGAIRITLMGVVGTAAGENVMDIRVAGNIAVALPTNAWTPGTGNAVVVIEGINATSQRYAGLGVCWGDTANTSWRAVKTGTLSLNVGSSWEITSYAGGSSNRPPIDHYLLVEKLKP